EKSFELHEGPPGLCQEVNGAKNWLRQLAPPESPCEFPHAAQDQDTAPPFRRCGKKSDRPRDRRNFVRAWLAHHPKRRIRQTVDCRPASNRRTKRPLPSLPNPPFGPTFCAVPVLPAIAKPGTAAAAAVPRSLTTPRSASPICRAVCGEIT